MPKDLFAQQPKDLFELYGVVPEKGPINRFMSGVGGQLLKSASAMGELLPKMQEGENLAKKYGNEGIANATGLAGEAGQFVGSTLPYMALPQSGLLKGAAEQAGLSAITTPGDIEERIKQAALTGASSVLLGGLTKGAISGFKPSEGAKKYMSEGIQPTVGQGISQDEVIGRTV